MNEDPDDQQQTLINRSHSSWFMWTVLTKNFMFECVLECARAQTDENWVWSRCFILTEWHDTEAGVSSWSWSGPGWNSLTFGRPISSSATEPRCTGSRKESLEWQLGKCLLYSVYSAIPGHTIREPAHGTHNTVFLWWFTIPHGERMKLLKVM